MQTDFRGECGRDVALRREDIGGLRQQQHIVVSETFAKLLMQHT